MARLDAQRVRDDEAPRPALVGAPRGLAHAAHERAIPEPTARGGAERGPRRVVAARRAVGDAARQRRQPFEDACGVAELREQRRR